MNPRLQEVIIELSYNCNLSCAMCGFGKHVNPFKKDKFMSFEKYRQILNQLANKTSTIRLNGRGESTIHPQFVEIVEFTKSSFPHLRINLFSNFSFRNAKILKTLIENEVQLFVSLDSTDTDELQQLRRGAKPSYIDSNLKDLATIETRPFIIFTIQEENLHRILDIAHFAHKYNCHIIYNTIRRDEGIDTFVENVRLNKSSIIDQFEMVNQLYTSSDLKYLCPDQLAGEPLPLTSQTKTHGTLSACPALQTELCILYDGTITPCNMFNPYAYGNIFHKSFEDLWNGEKRRSFLESHKAHYYCKNCSNLVA